MEQPLSSKALEANLAQTRTEEIPIPEEHQWFVELSVSQWGIHQRTRDFMLEYHHPYRDKQFVFDHWREILLKDLWFYNALDEADRAFAVLVDISAKILRLDSTDELRERTLQTVLEFVGSLTEQDKLRGEAIRQCLEVLEECLSKDSMSVVHASRYFKTNLAGVVAIPEYTEDVFRLTRNVLEKSIEFWESTSHVEQWFEDHHDLFQHQYSEVLSQIGTPYFARLRTMIEQAQEWQDLVDIPSFDGIANHFHRTENEFITPLEKIYFVVYLLDNPCMNLLKDNLLWDINRLLGNIRSKLDEDQLIAFASNLLNLFEGLKSDHTTTVLDCLLTLGKEVIQTGDQRIINTLQEGIASWGFITPGEISMTEDWQVQADLNHTKNIRVWMELIGYDPPRMTQLLSALIVNLRFGGVFISDTDLFQRDVTKLLNSNIGPVYKQIKELARIIPVYFSEIGAEGELREVTTAVDELSRRRDRLIHFLRKQTHTESNSTHMELAHRIIRFWHDGNLGALSELVPVDVVESIDLEGEWFIPVHEITQKLCKESNRPPEYLQDMDEDELRSYLSRISPYEERDKKRVEYLIKVSALLREKYSFETGNIAATLRKYRFFSEDDITKLSARLMSSDNVTALKHVYRLLGNLKQIVLNPEYSEPSETIYHKRHVAAGIPSMYGEYREPKFEALGLTFRLEKIASRTMEQIIDDIHRDYITTSTLRRICGVLSLFEEGLELDGISNQGFSSNLRMLESSFISASCSLDQYVNIFEFLETNVKEIIDGYFLNVYDQSLKSVIPQLMRNRESYSDYEIRQLQHKRSEEFYRDILSSAFLIQTLDNFLSRTMSALRSTLDHFPGDLVREVMTYDPDLITSPLWKKTPRTDNQIFLGAKAFFLKKLHAAGFPVPEGFVLTTELFRHRQAIFKHPQIRREIESLVRYNISQLERMTGHKFGNPANPLLLSVRAGTAISMPGAMATFLNVGMNEEIAEGLSKQPGVGRAAWDCYRRFLQSWGMTHGVDRGFFDVINAEFESRYNIASNIEFTPEQMREVVYEYKRVLSEHEIHVEQEPFQQLTQAILNVLDSWNSERAQVYRQHLQIADEWGTAVIVQKMVLGNVSNRSGTGVLFTHDPYESKSGINIYGDYALCGQGEDIVTGWLHTLPVTDYHRHKYQYYRDTSLESSFPDIYERLLDISSQLVNDFQLGPQEIEFTFESDRPEDLYILQTRRLDVQKPDKRHVFRVPQSKLELVGRGVGIGGGALSGILAFNMDDLQYYLNAYPDYARILVRRDTVPDDIGMIFNCDGLLTGKGGATSHAAVTAARLGMVCVVGCKGLLVNEAEKTCTINGNTFRSGDKISIDGNLGNIYRGHYPTELVEIK